MEGKVIELRQVLQLSTQQPQQNNYEASASRKQLRTPRHYKTTLTAKCLQLSTGIHTATNAKYSDVQSKLAKTANRTHEFNRLMLLHICVIVSRRSRPPLQFSPCFNSPSKHGNNNHVTLTLPPTPNRYHYAKNPKTLKKKSPKIGVSKKAPSNYTPPFFKNTKSIYPI